MSQDLTEKVTSTKRIYDGKIINLRVDSVLLPNGNMSQREIVEHKGAIAVVPMLDRDTVILVRQFRSATGGTLLEIPAGSLNEDEEIDVCAHRELAEEINFKAGHLDKLFSMYVAPGYSTEMIHVYIAYGLEPTAGETDEDEFLDIVKIPFAEALHKIHTGEIQDAKSISGLLQVERLLPNLEF
ncbi:ADP-ribose pyrophosphatase [Capsulimonas corticalis]|uniref:ADP-ribose pyrophosphatase n=1 Tax=Capsulimonas corticalis TaxID=2219043 RepID=A0A402CXF0_9BACT|nr:NUDIX hydrolase [Capsulimonas corticalis]BDI32309.1 ADP-ribose pyrophosphatase [Capsulimonas corticalis]